MATRAVRRGERWVLDGAKQWITSGDVAGVMVVWARTDPSPAGGRAVTAFLVEPGMPGFSVGRHEEKLGQRASTTVSLQFDGVELPDEARLGSVGQGLAVALSALDGGRIGIAAQATGTMRAALEAARGLRPGAQDLRQAHRRAPGRRLHAGRHGHRPRRRPGS